MASNEIVTKFTAEVADFQKKVTQIQKELDGTDKQTKKTDSAFKTFTKSLNANAGAMIAGYAAARGFIAAFSGAYNTLVSWGKAASDAEEITGKFNTVFRDLGSQASDSARNLAENYGLADTTAKELLSSTGDLLSGFGFAQSEALKLSESVNTLAVDLASFSNFSGGAEGASEALTKALLGEAESVKSLGIVINQNSDRYKELVKFYTEVEGKTEAQAKAYTALTIATEQSQNAIGDYARTSESTVNVTRRHQEAQKALREELGKTVISVATPFIAFLGNIEKGMADALRSTRAYADYLKTGLSADSLGDINDQIDGAKRRVESLRLETNALGEAANPKALAKAEADYQALLQKRTRIIRTGQQVESNKGALEKIERDKEASEKAIETRQLEYEKQKELDELFIIDQEEYYIKRAEQDNAYVAQRAAAIDAEEARLQQQVEFEAELQQQRLEASATFFSGWAALAELGAEKSFALAVAFKALASAEAAINSYLAFTKALASAPWPFNIAAASGVLAAGLAQQIKINSTQMPKFATGSGGAFTVPEGFQNDSFPIGVSSGEQVFVKNITQQMNSGNNMFHIVAKIGEKVIIDTVQEAYDNRKLILVEAV